MARLKATVIQSVLGYVGRVTDGKGCIWYATYNHNVSEFKVISDFKNRRTRKYFHKA